MKAKSTIMFKGKTYTWHTKNAINMDKGTERATNKALVTPIKNIKINGY
jgi:hypothetical protein